LQYGFQCIQAVNPLQKTASKRKARQNPAPRQTQHLIRQANPGKQGKPLQQSHKNSKPSTQARQAKNDRQGFPLVSDTKKAKQTQQAYKAKKPK
jgi:hypothetical protein